MAKEQKIPQYQGNPLIEALPPIYSRDEAAELLTYNPTFDLEAARKMPSHLRLHLIQLAASFVEPVPNLLELEQRFSRMIRVGYVGRNPSVPGYWPQLRREVAQLAPRPLLAPLSHAATRGFTVVGWSGVGKSTGIEQVLGLYPQVIEHGRYHRRPFTHRQLVWLKLECPQDGLLSGLCKTFFKVVDSLLGTPYFANYVGNGRRQVDQLVIDMADVAARHSIGVLVVDEIQNLKEAKGEGAAHMLNFLTQLDNMLGIPVVLIGTPSASPILTGEFRRARRAAGQGDLVWERMEKDGIWDVFLKALWDYQFLRVYSPLTADLYDTMYEESQGIADITVKLYLLAQIRAIMGADPEKEGQDEVITPDLIRTVSRKSLAFVQRFLKAIRENDQDELKKIGDLARIDLATLAKEVTDQVEDEKKDTRTSATEPVGVQDRQPTPEPQHNGTPPFSGPSGQQPVEHDRQPAQEARTNTPKRTLMELGRQARQENINAYEVMRVAGRIRRAAERRP